MVSDSRAQSYRRIHITSGRLIIGALALGLMAFASGQAEVNRRPEAKQDPALHTQKASKETPPGNIPAPAKPKADDAKTGTQTEKKGVELGSWPDWVIVGFTAFLAFLSWRQHVLESQLARDTKDSLSIAKQSADAALKMAESMSAAERAYLFGAANNIIFDVATATATVSLQLFNYGKTPARIRRIEFGTLEVTEPPSEIADYSAATVWTTDTVISAGEKESKITTLPGLPYRGLVYGRLFYSDVFKIKHESRFCMAYDAIASECATAGSDDWNSYD